MEPEQLVADGTITGNLCFSDSTGSIISNVTGGTEAYEYAWTGPGVFASMDPDIFDLIPGTYDLTVTDDHGCEATYQGILVEPALIIPMETLTNPSCIGNEDGSILLDMTGGTGTLTYVWTGPGTFMSMDEDITGLGPGGYQVEITDDNSCAVEADYVLIALQVMAFSATSVNIDCNGSTNGSIDIEVSGGLETYGYSWIGPVPFTAITQDIADLLAGEYEVLITDQNGCELDTLITLTEPETLIAAEQSVVDLNCNGDLSGAISLDISGGTLDYTLLWSGPNDFTSIEEDISGLEAGDYVLDVIDFNGCALSLPFIVYEPAAISIISTSITDAICENSPDGSIDVDISGGVPGYETSWSGPNGFSSTNEDLTGILPGTYTLSVTDDHGCIESVPFTVAYQLEILADAGTYDPICNGNQVFLDGSNSSGAQSYNWTLLSGLSLSNQVTTNVQASTANSVVILTITNGFCIDRDTLNLDILLLPIVNAGEDQTTFLGEQVTLGGDPTADDAASYNWFPPQLLDDSSHPNPIYVNSGTQTFSVTVVGNNGCIASDDVIITLDPSIEIPDGFTPNGDQVNDVWVLGNRGLFPNLVAQIFSRWGDELFKSAPGYPDPWNGEFNNAPLPVGTYYYIIELNDPKFPDAVTGPLTIFR
jgi:gliding motility-associated-like protein